MASNVTSNEAEANMKKIQEGTSCTNSVVTCSSTASRKRRAELRLHQLKEKQETERRSEEARRELELQSARHELELAEIEEEDFDDRGVLSLPDEPATDVRVENYVKDLPDNTICENLCDNIPSRQIYSQNVYGLPKPELIKFSGNPADYCNSERFKTWI